MAGDGLASSADLLQGLISQLSRKKKILEVDDTNDNDTEKDVEEKEVATESIKTNADETHKEETAKEESPNITPKTELAENREIFRNGRVNTSSFLIPLDSVTGTLSSVRELASQSSSFDINGSLSSIDNAFKCTKCEYSTKQRYAFNSHVEEEHPMTLEYICHDCDFKSTDKEERNKHVSGEHPKSRFYPCLECNYKGNYFEHDDNHQKLKICLFRF